MTWGSAFLLRREVVERRAAEERMIREIAERRALEDLLQLSRAIGLLGARCLVSGMSPRTAEVAATLGVDLRALSSHATLEAALQEALRGMSKR